MRITVTFFGQARQLAGTDRRVVEVADDATVADVVAAATQDEPEVVRKLLFTEDDALRRNILAPVNGTVVDTTTKGSLQDNDDVAIYTALAGG